LPRSQLENRSELERMRQFQNAGQTEAVPDVEVGAAPLGTRITVIDWQRERQGATSFRARSVVVCARVRVDGVALERTGTQVQRHVERVALHRAGRLNLDDLAEGRV